MGARRGHGEGSVYKRKSDGAWVATVDLGVVDGRRIRRTKYAHTRREAIEALAGLQRQAGHAPTGAPAPTVSEWMADWIATIEPNRAVKTVQDYRGLTRRWVNPHLGGRRIDRLTPMMLEKWAADLVRSGLSPRSAQYAFATVRAALYDAVRLGLIGVNPAAHARAPRQAERIPDPLSVDEAKRILAVDHPLRGAFTMALTMGLRSGELRNLRWADIDTDTATLMVERGKTKASRRTLAIPTVALAALPPRGAPNDLVFPHPISGRRLEDRQLLYRWHRVTEATIGRRTRFHATRHTAATLALLSGTSLRVVSEQLGHTDVRVTANTYTSVVDALKRDAAARMDSLFSE